MNARPKVNFKPEAWVKIGELIEHPKNPRIDLRQDKGRFESLKESILEGVFEPVKVSRKTGYCLAGNQRIKAFQDLGFEEVPVMYNDCENEKEEIQVIIKDNNEWGAYDYDQLDALVKANELALETLGFNDMDLKFLEKRQSSDKDLIEDDVPEAPAVPTAKLGDIYQLGDHRLMCGDSTSIEDVKKLMNGQKADLVFTDPPYNVNYKGRGKKTSNTIENDHMGREEFRTFLTKVFEAYREAVKSSAPFYVCHSSSSQRDFEDAMESVGLKVKNQIIWNKTVASMGWGDYRWKHEPFYYASKEKCETQFYGDRTHSTIVDLHKTEDQLMKWIKEQQKAEKEGKFTIWTMKRDKVNDYQHPTQKPVELITYALVNSSKQGDVVLDPFMGSGSTLIACEKTNRAAVGFELDPTFVDVIVQRWVDFTGIETITKNGKQETWAKTEYEQKPTDTPPEE